MNDEKPERLRVRRIDRAACKVIHYLPSLLQWRHEVLGTMERPSSARCEVELHECEIGLHANVLRGVAEFADVLYYATVDDLRNPRVVMCFLRLLDQLRRSSWYEALKLIHGKWTLGSTANGPLATRSYEELKTTYRSMASEIASVITPRERDSFFSCSRKGGKRAMTPFERPLRPDVSRCLSRYLPAYPSSFLRFQMARDDNSWTKKAMRAS